MPSAIESIFKLKKKIVLFVVNFIRFWTDAKSKNIPQMFFVTVSYQLRKTNVD